MEISDPALLGAYRKQLRVAVDAGHDPGLVFMGWLQQPGISRDDLIDELKAVEQPVLRLRG
jgi:hypothetical protein